MFGGQRQHTWVNEQTFWNFERQLEGHLPKSIDNEDSNSEDKNPNKSEPVGKAEFCQRNAESNWCFMIKDSSFLKFF